MTRWGAASLNGFLLCILPLTAISHGHRLIHKLLHYIADRQRHRDRWVAALRRILTALSGHA